MAASYDMNHRFRGTALIIGNEFRGQKGGERAGCSKDVTMMEEVFRKLDFRVQVFMNLSADQMKEKLYNASQDKNNEYSDCFVLGLSTHGHEVRFANVGQMSAENVWRHGVLGEDGTTLFVDEIIDLFTDEKAKGLIDKPKLFFLQACRSREHDIYSPSPSPGDGYDQGDGVDVLFTEDELTEEFRKTLSLDVKDSPDSLHSVDLMGTEDIYKDWEKDPDEWQQNARSIDPSVQVSEHDASRGLVEEDAGGSADSNTMPSSPFDEVAIRCPEDFLIMYPVMSGKYAFRHRRAGSYLIQFLHKNLRELLLECDVLQYLTNVCKDMANHECKPNLDTISNNNRFREKQAKLAGTYFDPLCKFKNYLYANIKYLSAEENQDLLLKVIGKGHESSLKGHPANVETSLRSIIPTLSEGQMKSILEVILPFKMAACVVHRLKSNVVFKPKRENTPMGKLKRLLSPPGHI